MSECTCGYNGWFAPPCDACILKRAQETVDAFSRPKPESEIDRLRRELAEAKAELAKRKP